MTHTACEYWHGPVVPVACRVYVERAVHVDMLDHQGDRRHHYPAGWIIRTWRSSQSREYPLVGEGGLEPPRGLPHRILNPARLPIPPLAQTISL